MLTSPLDCQVYLLRSETQLALVDAGSGEAVDKILDNVVADGLDPEAIRWLLITHAHADHAAGAAGLKQRLPNLSVAISSDAAEWLENGDEQATSLAKGRERGLYPASVRLLPCPVDLALEDRQEIAVGELRIRVINTPGHCRGHVSFLVDIEGKRTLFSGDALFPGGRILLQNIWDCNLQDSVRSIERLAEAKVDHLMAGHLPPVLDDAESHIRLATDRLWQLAVPLELG